MELYSVKPDGTDLITNSGSLIPNGHVISFAWSNDSSQLAFVADQDIDNIFELHKVGSDALNLIKVSGDAFAGQSVKSYQFEN